MNTKSLLYGLIGFFAGGLLVSIVATTFNKAAVNTTNTNTNTPVTMDQMADVLRDKTEDEFDQAFIAGMIVHHEGAVEMAKMAETQAKHDEIKQLSKDIITAQEKEIVQMKQWQTDWGYSADDSSAHMNH